MCMLWVYVQKKPMQNHPTTSYLRSSKASRSETIETLTLIRRNKVSDCKLLTVSSILAVDIFTICFLCCIENKYSVQFGFIKTILWRGHQYGSMGKVTSHKPNELNPQIPHAGGKGQTPTSCLSTSIHVSRMAHIPN